jgi:hypothetical protein
LVMRAGWQGGDGRVALMFEVGGCSRDRCSTVVLQI